MPESIETPFPHKTGGSVSLTTTKDISHILSIKPRLTDTARAALAEDPLEAIRKTIGQRQDV